jgi:hypothetical protein
MYANPMTATSYYIVFHKDGTKEKRPTQFLTDTEKHRDDIMGYRGSRRKGGKK